MPATASRNVATTCCIAGGGPAGLMLGYLLARAGVEVIVLEKHKDFLRDFRGDTVHPSTLEIFHELGLLSDFLKLPHTLVQKLVGFFGKDRLWLADFSLMPTHCKAIALMPQWDLLNFIAERGRAHPGFQLRMRTEALDLIREGERVTGVRVHDDDGEYEITADLVVASDGRGSILRDKAGFIVEDHGAPLDVFWFRLPAGENSQGETLGRFTAGAILVELFRGDYWQCAFVIQKGSADQVRAEGLEKFQQRIAAIAPEFGDRVSAITSWDDVKLLTVKVDSLKTWWKPGLLCIGDASHAMSPLGGVGINLAVQDAVAAANILAAPLKSRTLTHDHLAQVQKRRQFPARMTQKVQIFMQNRVIAPTLSAGGPLRAPMFLKLLTSIPLMRAIPAYLIGVGVQPEHVRTPDSKGPTSL